MGAMSEGAAHDELQQHGETDGPAASWCNSTRSIKRNIASLASHLRRPTVSAAKRGRCHCSWNGYQQKNQGMRTMAAKGGWNDSFISSRAQPRRGAEAEV